MKIHCPMCHAELEVESSYETRPFCSPRCKKQDLSNWLEGVYRLPREILPEDLEHLPQEERDELLQTALSEAVKRHIH
jgi:endogenous inhibitor of DNA gyrase (YacG/DUF329 family)